MLRRIGLALLAWLWVLRVEWRSRRLRFDEIVAWLEGATVRERRSVSTHETLAALRCAGRLTPFRRSCLKESLAGVGLLRSLGYEARLRIGVKGAETPVDAHAWIEVDGAPLHRGAAGYVPLGRTRS